MDTCSIVYCKTRQPNPLILQFNCPCNELLTIVWSMFYTT